ncbi:MAG TPA: DNA internalization-related competence protein ComEC/Rec2 [Marinobacterium sp.]|nr:DNA internalization-related competence protein ComEC/Rec2 [Marinobacterium sp.]
MIGYLLGLILAARMPTLDWTHLLASMGLLLPLILLRLPYRLQLVSCMLAFSYSSVWGLYQLEHRLPQAVAKVDVQLRGQIDTLVLKDDRIQRFELQLIQAPEAFPRLRRVQLTHYSVEPALKQGDQITLIARLQTPQRFLNFASPDSKRRALQRAIDARGYVRELLAHEHEPGLRQRLYDQLMQRLPPDSANTLSAVVLGESSGLQDKQWSLLRATGTVHLVVVSGLHLGVLTLAGLIIGRSLLFPLLLLKPSFARLIWGLPVVLALTLASTYLWLGGAGLALQRAWVLVALLLTGRLWGRSISLRTRLKAALVVVTLLDPLTVLDLGFWLSFGLVWLLLQHARWRTNSPRWLVPLRVQLFLSIALLPVLLVGIGQLNLIGVFTNLWAIPWLSFGVMLLPILLPLALMSNVFAQLVALWSDALWRGLALSADLGLSSDWTRPPEAFLPLALAGILLLLLPLRLRLMGALMLMPLLLYPVERVEGFRVRMMDVGQGQASIIDLPSSRWIYDTGPSFGANFSAAELTLIPTLKNEPQVELQGLIVSHSDRDHSGGLGALLQYRQPSQIYSGQPELTGGKLCREGQLFIDGEVEMRLTGITRPINDNDASCVVLLSYRSCHLLMAGDLSSGAELILLRQFQPLSLTWLMLSHHGSRSSTSDAWLDFWSPQTVLLSRGRNNPFGHPHPEVIERVESRRLKLVDTAIDGEIELVADAQGCRTETFSERQRRYWY